MKNGQNKQIATKGLAVLMAAGLSMAVAMPAQADLVVPNAIASWDNQGLPGTQEATPGVETAHVTAKPMVRGAGITVHGGPNSLNSERWDSTNPADDYIQFGFTVTPGYQVQLDDLLIGTRSSGSGPGTMGIYGAMDGGAYSYLSSIDQTYPAGADLYANTLLDLSWLGPVAQSFTIQLRPIGTNAAQTDKARGINGTFRVSSYVAAGGTYYANQITGSASAVPVPAAVWLLGSGLLGVVGLRRKNQ